MPSTVAWLKKPVVAILLVTALAGFVRFFHLGHPGEFVFDEVYYPKAGCILIGDDDDVCLIDSDDEKYWRKDKWDVGSWVHPPLGKWQIGLGIKAFGMDPFGWRFSSALAGTLVVTLVAVMAQALFRQVAWTYVAGGLLAIEHLNVVMSRTALLDVHLELWVVAGFTFLVLDRRWLERRQDAMPFVEPEPPPMPGDPGTSATTDTLLTQERLPPVYSPLWRPWRFAAGIALGAAASVKWSGAMAMFAALVLSFLWEVSRRHRLGVSWGSALFRAFARESFGLAIAFVVLPIGVFLLAWLPWIHHFDWDWGKWWDTQTGSFRYHMREGLKWTDIDPDTGSATPTHPYYARWWEWVLPPGRPTSFFVKDLGPDIQQILALASPSIMWLNLFAVPFLAWAWLSRKRRDWRAGFILVAFLGLLLPWIGVDRPTFYFYLLPITPFIVLAVTYFLREVSDVRLVSRDRGTGEVAVNPETGEPAISVAYVYRPFVWAYLLATAILFVWFWPVLTAGQVTDVHWRTIVWFNRWI
jgi:dolichyl-phosphate-mannose--protein O-mannosyl transferase